MRILILTDSLALPRESPENCKYEETWPSIIKNKGYIVHQVSIGGATSATLLSQINYHLSFNPDIVIIQVGIVDCAPRFLKKNELFILKKIPFFGRKIISSLNNKVVRKVRNINYVNAKSFKKNIIAIKNLISTKTSQVYFLSIIPASLEYEEKLPNISKNIRLYNQIIYDISFNNYISLDSMPIQGIMSDHHHINSVGHEYIANILLKTI